MEHELLQGTLIKKARLPSGWDGLPHPDTWNQQLTEQFANHIWEGQQGLIADERRFQLRQNTSDAEAEALQETQDPYSKLKYGPEAQLFLRRLMEAGDNDLHAQAEVRSHLPGVPEEEGEYLPFDEVTFAELGELVADSDVMTRLLKAAQGYEQYGPIQVRGYA